MLILIAPDNLVLAEFIVPWQKRHGRHHLPWQHTGDVYSIWLSEIMLQQTQVATVLGYYANFLERFPSIQSLAQAPLDDVLSLWAGLGYYARARNLHRCAQTVVYDLAGHWPHTAEQLQSLPGIGRSTAAAIAAFAFHEPVPIMDGNVKRLFARFFGIETELSEKKTEDKLWHLAVQHLPSQCEDMPAYTQGLMDMGATVCTRSKPVCMLCPVQEYCVARATGRQDELPKRRSRKAIPQRSTIMVLVQQGENMLLERRPEAGVWGGLWSLLEIPAHTQAVTDTVISMLDVEPTAISPLPSFTHRFTHFQLNVTPWQVDLPLNARVRLPEHTQWLKRAQLQNLGMPAPVRKFLNQFGALWLGTQDQFRIDGKALEQVAMVSTGVE